MFKITKCRVASARFQFLYLVLLTGIAIASSSFGSIAFGAQKKLVVFGDSLTAGYGLKKSAAFTSVLEERLRKTGRDVVVVNASVSGDTTASGLARIDWALGAGGDAIIVELGANDMLRGIDPARTRRALDGIIEKIKKRNLPLLLAGMKAAPGMGKTYEKQFNKIYSELAAKHNVLLYPFFLDGVASVRSLNLADAIHPNSEGVKVLVDRILPSVLQLLNMVKKK